MNLIYCESEKIKRKRSIKEFLINYYDNGCPETYFVGSNDLQCKSNKLRSFDDIYLLVKYYYPSITYKKLANIGVELYNHYKDKKGEFLIIRCPTINKIIFSYYKNLYISREIERELNFYKNTPIYHYFGYESIAKNSKYQINDIKKMIGVE
jgi:hypothetical protein